MKQLLIILFFTIGILNLTYTQTPLKQNIRGTVVDATTGYPLIGANIILLNSEPPLGATTDINGKFELLFIPLGRHDLEIRYLGYQSQVLNNLLLSSAKEVVVNAKLTENAIAMNEVIVKAGKTEERKSKRNGHG